MKKQITIRDVAEKTGFSFQTVSRVLNGKAELHKASTVRKVEKVATELGYVQNIFAKGMQSGKTYSVGLVIDPFLESFTKAIFLGAHDELMKRNYLPILLIRNGDTSDADLVKRLAERRVEGIIIRPFMENMAEVSEAIRSHGMHAVSVDYALNGEKKFDFVGTADEHGGQMAAEHLLELGHRNMAGIFAVVESAQLRQRGFENTILRNGDINQVTSLPDWDFEDEDLNLERVKKILQGENRPTAIFAAGDFMLPTVYKAANELELSIPDDLSVIGFGDTELTQYLMPPATTLHQDAYEIGVQAALLVLDRIENKERELPIRQMRFEPHLVSRESTAPPKKD